MESLGYFIDLAEERFNVDMARNERKLAEHAEVMASVTTAYSRYENLLSYVRGWGYVTMVGLHARKHRIETDRDEMVHVLKFLCV